MGTTFDKQIQQSVMDITGDDSDMLKKQRSIMKWDQKKKKYIRIGKVSCFCLLLFPIREDFPNYFFFFFRTIRVRRLRQNLERGSQLPTKVIGTNHGKKSPKLNSKMRVTTVKMMMTTMKMIILAKVVILHIESLHFQRDL